MSVSVQRDAFDMGAEIAALTATDKDIGAVVTFTGLVREMTQAGAIQTMELEHYPGMTEKALQDIADQARGRWPLQGLRLIHRYGRWNQERELCLSSPPAGTGRPRSKLLSF